MKCSHRVEIKLNRNTKTSGIQMIRWPDTDKETVKTREE